MSQTNETPAAIAPETDIPSHLVPKALPEADPGTVKPAKDAVPAAE